MRLKSQLFITVSLLIFAVSCTSSHDEMLTKITGMETAMKNTRPPDTAKLAELVSAYQGFAHKFPKDSLAPECLFKAAGLSLSMNRTTQSLEIFNSIQSEYPSYRKVPECLFMRAFIYENTVADLGKASQLYNEFLAKNTTHQMADDARNALKYLGKPADE